MNRASGAVADIVMATCGSTIPGGGSASSIHPLPTWRDPDDRRVRMAMARSPLDLALSADPCLAATFALTVFADCRPPSALACRWQRSCYPPVAATTTVVPFPMKISVTHPRTDRQIHPIDAVIRHPWSLFVWCTESWSAPPPMCRNSAQSSYSKMTYMSAIDGTGIMPGMLAKRCKAPAGSLVICGAPSQPLELINDRAMKLLGGVISSPFNAALERAVIIHGGFTILTRNTRLK